MRRAVDADLRPPLKETDAQYYLPLSGVGQRVPLLGGGGRRDRSKRLPREFDAVRLNDVAHETGHRDTPVLDLRVPEPADGLLVVVVPELGLSKLERIPVADNRIEL